jgi:ectoine hydroxylase-related dioxygenase (phytanoyl-CoA dioxygenase family)
LLSAAELEQYDREGLSIPQQALPASYVQQVRDKVETFTAAHPDLDPDYIPSIVEHDRDWLEYAKHPDVLDCVEQVIGPDIVVWGSALFCKSAGGGKATPWHQDGQYWPIRPLATCTVWIAFDEVATENGCMRFVPGSHLEKRTYEHETDNSDAYTLNQTVAARDEAEANAKDVELSPGMFSVHDVYLIHGSNRNDSEKRRGGLVFRYMPTTSHYDRDLARQQVRELGVLDISERQLHLVRGGDACGKNDIFQG